MKTIEEREREFRKQVYDIGRVDYTPEMLSRFVAYWSEPDRAKGIRQKMRFEREKTWRTDLRLKTWARNNFDKIICYSTESQRTIAQKRHDFARALQPYLDTEGGKYDKDFLNDFWAHWTQPENVKNPTRLQWELEEFWSFSTRLEKWKNRNGVPKRKVG